jgi:hypothetical protein
MEKEEQYAFMIVDECLTPICVCFMYAIQTYRGVWQPNSISSCSIYDIAKSRIEDGTNIWNSLEKDKKKKVELEVTFEVNIDR